MPTQVSSSRRVRLFKNEHLEQLTLISPRVFALSWGIMLPLIAIYGWRSAHNFSPIKIASLIAGGLLAWTLFEYAMHRFLFHLESNKPWLKWFVHLIHGNHHVDPNDPLRGLMPLPVSISTGLLIWAACFMLLGSSGTWAFLGFMIGYVLYDVIHFACHQWPMRSRFGVMFKRHHMRHHHIDENGNFAISALFWDHVFATRIRSLKRKDG